MSAETFTHPLPGDVLSGKRVIASVIYREPDNEAEPIEYTLILLNEGPPFYTVGIYKSEGFGGFTPVIESNFPNIVPAVREYEQMGGDF